MVGIPICDLINQRDLMFETDKEQITVSEIVDMFLERFNGLEQKLQSMNLMNSSRLGALFVVDDRIVQTDHVITGDTTMKILPPICGG
jgi:molybdopterin converting factor small subunit